MTLYEFRLGGRLALTIDATGDNLPGNGWAFVQNFDLNPEEPRDGASYEEIASAVRQAGFFIWPVET
jgi:hypothetical protein